MILERTRSVLNFGKDMSNQTDFTTTGSIAQDLILFHSSCALDAKPQRSLCLLYVIENRNLINSLITWLSFQKVIAYIWTVKHHTDT